MALPVPFDFSDDGFFFWNWDDEPKPAQRGDYKRALLADPCAYCGAPSTVVDHIHARARGGVDHWANYAGLCTPCNLRKKDRSVLGFLGLELRRPDLEAAQAAFSAWVQV